MTLSELVIELLASRDLTVGLALGSRELGDLNYIRSSTAWRIDNASMTATVSFGPFDSAVKFDRAVLYHDQEPIHTLTFEEPLHVGRGMHFDDVITFRTVA